MTKERFNTLKAYELYKSQIRRPTSPLESIQSKLITELIQDLTHLRSLLKEQRCYSQPPAELEDAISGAVGK